MISVENAGHGYRPGHWLFRRLNFRVRPGRITAVLGPNGRGKTTLLRGIAGSVPFREGTVRCPEPIGYVPQALATDIAYSALDMVMMGRSRHLGRFSVPGAADRARALAELGHVGLSDIADRRFHHLSGGQRQLVLIARALAGDCPALVLDEPASALDLANQGVVLRLLRRLADEGRAIVLTTHHPDHALAIADDALLMLEGEAPLFGPAREVLDEASLSRLYGVRIHRLSWQVGSRSGQAVIPLHDVMPPTSMSDLQ